MFLWWCCVALFQDVATILDVTIGVTVGFTAFVFLATFRARQERHVNGGRKMTP